MAWHAAMRRKTVPCPTRAAFARKGLRVGSTAGFETGG